MWEAIANEIESWLLAAFGLKKATKSEREQRRQKSQRIRMVAGTAAECGTPDPAIYRPRLSRSNSAVYTT
jgi:hypothetical protein